MAGELERLITALLNPAINQHTTNGNLFAALFDTLLPIASDSVTTANTGTNKYNNVNSKWGECVWG